MSEVKNQLNSIEAKIDNILEQNNTVIGGSYKELYNTFHQNDESSWNYTSTSKVSLIVYVSCIHDGNNGNNSIVGKLNNSVITPSLTMIGTYYSSPITYVYTIDVNAGDTLYFSATPTVKTSNEEAQRSFTSVVVYYISE